MMIMINADAVRELCTKLTMITFMAVIKITMTAKRDEIIQMLFDKCVVNTTTKTGINEATPDTLSE